MYAHFKVIYHVLCEHKIAINMPLYVQTVSASLLLPKDELYFISNFTCILDMSVILDMILIRTVVRAHCLAVKLVTE